LIRTLFVVLTHIIADKVLFKCTKPLTANNLHGYHNLPQLNESQFSMKKKPDILLLLSLLAFFGVLISHFMVIQPSSKNTTLSFLASQKPSASQDAHTNYPFSYTTEQTGTSATKSQEIVHIDSSKRQTH